MLSPQIYSGAGFTGPITDKEFKDVLGSAGKCIMVVGGVNGVIERCQMDNFSKAAIHLQNCSGVSIKDIYADAKMNATENYCKGIMLENCSDVLIDGFIAKNFDYYAAGKYKADGTKTYWNGEGLLVEAGCKNITLQRFLVENAPDACVDGKEHFTAKSGIVRKVHRGFRPWKTMDLVDVSIEDCDEGIWISATTTKVRLTRVSFKNCTRKISDDNGNEIPLTDPRIELVDAGAPVIQLPVYTGPGVTPTPTPVPTVPVDPQDEKWLYWGKQTWYRKIEGGFIIQHENGGLIFKTDADFNGMTKY